MKTLFIVIGIIGVVFIVVITKKEEQTKEAPVEFGFSFYRDGQWLSKNSIIMGKAETKSGYLLNNNGDYNMVLGYNGGIQVQAEEATVIR